MPSVRGEGLPCARRHTMHAARSAVAVAITRMRSGACSSHSAVVEVVEWPATVVELLCVAGEDLTANSGRRSCMRRTIHAPLGVSDR